MELSTTVLYLAKDQCRLAVQAQEEEERVKKSRSASSENMSVPVQIGWHLRSTETSLASKRYHVHCPNCSRTIQRGL